MMALFPPKRTLLYPQFETYRLHSLDPSADVISFPLPGSGATQSRLEYGQHNLSFKEVRGRIAWDHLALDEEGRGVYVDKEWNVTGFTLQDDLTPRFSHLASLPQPISTASSSSSTVQTPEYPSAIAITPGIWAVSSGSGSLHLLHTREDFSSGDITALYDLGGPVLIRSAHTVNENDVRLLLSRSTPRAETKRGRSSTTTFELLEISIDPSRQTATDVGIKLEANWVMQGGDLPLYCTWSDGGWLVLSGETYGPAQATQPGQELETDEERIKRETQEKVGKLGLGATLPPQAETPPVAQPPMPEEPPTPRDQPYTWTQTGDSASIRIQFAAGTKRTDLLISLKAGSFALRVSGGLDQAEALRAFLRCPEHSWWAEIDLDLSSLSFDPATAVLELDITKIDSNHRWPALFLPADDDDESADFPETLNASTLAAVRETFDNVRTRNADEPEGNHPAIPSLLREEMDFDMEDGEDFEDRASGALGDVGGKVGREVFIGTIKDGQAKWSKATTSVVSLPLQAGNHPLAARSEAEIIVKSAVDGLLFSPPDATHHPDPTRSPWTHRATVPALAFVLSSKRDIRLVRHSTPRPNISASSDASAPSTEQYPTVFAFDSGSSSAGQGNAYVYYPPTSKIHAKQGVVSVSGGERGAMLGVGAIRWGERDLAVVLCEKELVLLPGVT